MNAHGTTAIQSWTLVVAGFAVVATLVSAYFLRRTGKDAARAAEKSAQAAQDAVTVNREAASVVARQAEADALAKRYQDAALQLGHASPAVRLAGVYAMAAVADDWSSQRQQCIDVLCAYLRISSGEGEVDVQEVEVRAAILDLLVSRTQRWITERGQQSWSDIHFNLAGAALRDLNLSGCAFNHPLILTGATLSGTTYIGQVGLASWSLFDRVTIDGATTFALHLSERDHVEARQIKVARGASLTVYTNSIADEAHVNLDEMIVYGAVELIMCENTEWAGDLTLRRVEVCDGGSVSIRKANYLFTRRPEHVPSVLLLDWTVGRATVTLSAYLVSSGRLWWHPQENGDESSISKDAIISIA